MIVTVFRSRLRDEGREAYFELAPRMGELARTMPGYKSHKVFVAEDGERLTLVEFDSAEAQRGWSTQLDHVAAKKQGRQDFYAEYRLQVCEVIRESRFQADDAATNHP
ncbi:antibiotic biosynthesis monooxygenase family protein [Roseateles sp. BYS78W]|uniref:Antibiotic biosynthesis monooxygenase family protein n=1 Tax=Pelomonas candidula TaxID=3299025 RepID=A0ABW7HKK5_9BURK